MTRRDWILGFIVAIVFAGIVAFSSWEDKPRDRETVVIGVSPFQDTILPYVGEVKGWYEEEGLDVEFRILGWEEVLEALSAPEGTGVDVAIYNICGVVGGHANNPDLVYAYGANPFDRGAALLVRPDGGFLGIEDFEARGMEREDAVRSALAQLKGKTIVTTSNTDMEQNVWSAVRKGGLDFDRDVQIVNLPPPEGLGAFLDGEGDAYLGGVPQRFAGVQRGMVELVTGSDLGPAPINGFVTTRQFLARDREKLTKILRVWFRIVEHTNQNIDDTARIVSEKMNETTPGSISPQDFKDAWNVIESYPPTPDAVAADILSPNGKNYWRRRWDACNTYYVDVSRTMSQPTPSDSVFVMEEVQEGL